MSCNRRNLKNGALIYGLYFGSKILGAYSKRVESDPDSNPGLGSLVSLTQTVVEVGSIYFNSRLCDSFYLPAMKSAPKTRTRYTSVTRKRTTALDEAIGVSGSSMGIYPVN